MLLCESNVAPEWGEWSEKEDKRAEGCVKARCRIVEGTLRTVTGNEQRWTRWDSGVQPEQAS